MNYANATPGVTVYMTFTVYIVYTHSQKYIILQPFIKEVNENFLIIYSVYACLIIMEIFKRLKKSFACL